MKKFVFVFAGVLAVAISAHAQDSYKPEAMDFSLEMNYTPGFLGTENSASFTLPEYGVKGRLFLSDRFAVKMNLGFTTFSTNDREYVAGQGDNSVTITDDINRGSSFSIMPGVEYHLGNYKRVSPYVGAAIGIAAGSTGTKDVTGNVTTTTTRPLFGMAIEAAAGVDVYICHGLYAGVEMGLGYQYSKLGKGKAVAIDAAGTRTETDGTTETINNDFGFFAMPSLRIGWFF